MPSLCANTNWQIVKLPLSQQATPQNADGTLYKDRPIKEECHLLLLYKGHSKQKRLLIGNTGNDDVVLGHNWLQQHNPKVDWVEQTIEMTHCPCTCHQWQSVIASQLAVKTVKQEETEEELCQMISKEFHDFLDLFHEHLLGTFPMRKK